MAIIRGTAIDDIRSGTSGHDIFQFFQGGEDGMSGHGGNDIFKLGGALSAGDAIIGGAGVDRLYLNGDYSGGFTFGDQLISIEHIRVEGNFDYALTMDDANVLGHQALTVHADGLGAGHALTFDGSAETTGHFVVFGSAGNDALTGGARNDRFWLDGGGNDTAHGGVGNDLFKMGNEFDASDQIDGGGGYDKIVLNGGAYGALTLNSNTIHDIEEIDMVGGNSYFLETNNGNVAAGAHLLVDASQSTGQFTFHGFNETDGTFTIITGSGNVNTVYGGNGNDVADFRHGASSSGQFAFDDTGGDDTVYVGGNYPNSPNFNGGTGNDTFVLDGSYTTLNLKGGIPGLRSFETIKFTAGHNYGDFSNAITVTNDLSSTAVNGAASGETVTYDGSALGSGDTMHLDLSGSSTAANIIKGGAGNDNLTGNGNNDTFIGGLGRDSISGGAGHDTYVVNDVSESTSWVYDATLGIDFDNDKIDLNIAAPSAIDTAFGGGSLSQSSQSTFDNGVEAAVGASQLAAGHAVIWTPDAGDYNGVPLLIVDGNNTAGYQAGQDYIFYIFNYTGTLDTGDFI